MSKQYDQHVVIKSLDNPMRILFWNLPDFIVLVLPFFLGLLLENSMVFFGGLILRWACKRLFRSMPKGLFKRMIYWYLPTKTVNSCMKTNFPPSHIRKYLH